MMIIPMIRAQERRDDTRTNGEQKRVFLPLVPLFLPFSLPAAAKCSFLSFSAKYRISQVYYWLSNPIQFEEGTTIKQLKKTIYRAG
jgi:hypothetical protein